MVEFSVTASSPSRVFDSNTIQFYVTVVKHFINNPILKISGVWLKRKTILYGICSLSNADKPWSLDKESILSCIIL